MDIKFGFHYNADLLFVFKNLRRIIPEGFDQPHKDQDIVEFLNNTIDHLQMIVLEHDKFNTDLLERYVKCYSKLYVSLIKTNPTSFILLPCCEKILTTFLSILEQKAEVIYNSSEDNDFWEILALRSFSILKKVLAYIYRAGAVTLKQKMTKWKSRPLETNCLVIFSLPI